MLSNLRSSSLQSIAFIDGSVGDQTTLLSSLDIDHVVILDAQQNGIEQISQTLTQYQSIDSVHLFTHGSSATLQLGNTTLNASTLDSYGADLESWGDALSANADILLYGCNVASDANGDAFVQQIGALTGADIAASDDATGSNSDWDLEVTIGVVETGIGLDAVGQAAFSDTLNLIDNGSFDSGLNSWRVSNGVPTTTSDAFDGDSALSLSASGRGVRQSFQGTAGESYTLEVYGKKTSDGWGGVGLTFYDDNWGRLGKTGTGITSQDWSMYSITVEAPADTEHVTVWSWNSGTTGATFLDSVTVDIATDNPNVDPDEILTNPDFEMGLTRWNGFTGTERSTTNSFSGDQALELSTARSGVNQRVDITPGQTYELSAYAQTNNDLWNGIGLRFRTSDGTAIETNQRRITTSAWGLYEIEAVAPANAASAEVFVWNGGASGSTLIDAVSFKQEPGGGNNQAPTITSNGGATSASLTVAENNNAIANIDATDPEGDTEGSGLTYSLQGPDISQLSIDPNTGQLSFNSAPDFENPTDSDGNNQYEVDVIVTDSQDGQDTQSLAITVTDEVEVSPSVFALADIGTTFVNETAGDAVLTVVRTGGSQGRITVQYTTNEISGAGAATANSDYTTPTFNGLANTGEIVFEDGETEKTVAIPILDDTVFEGNETFSIGLQNPSAGSLGLPRTTLITIVDNDAAPTLSISEAAVTVSESDSNVSVTVQRSGDVSGTATVNFSTDDSTAIAGSDYTATVGTLNFAPNQTIQTITIPLLEDSAVEETESFSVGLSNPSGATLGTQRSSTISILDNDLALGDLTRTTVVSGLTEPTTLDWTPNGDYMLVAEKSGRVRVIDENGTLRGTPLVDLSPEVNDTRDRGLLGLAIHPNFPSDPYVYLLYTYDPPETAGQTGLGAPDANGNRPSRMVRLSVNPNTMIADPASLTVLTGTNSTWQYTSQPTNNSTGNNAIPPSGIVNGTTITAPASQIDQGTQDNDPDRPGIQNLNVRDYLATDSESHSIGDIEFGPDGYLYLSNGDGTSYTFADPRTVRVQDLQNLSGKLLRIDPITGEGLATNPFFNGDVDSNQSKVFYSGLRNPFRVTFDPVTDLPVIGDVGWTRWEEINTGSAGTNFGWPYFEGPERTGRYQDLPQAIAFYDNGNRNNPGDTAAVFPILSRVHGAPDNARAIVLGDFYNSNTLMFGDVNNGTLYAATLDNNRQVTNVQVFDAGISSVVDMNMGPDGRLYGVNLVSGSILRWDPDTNPSDDFSYNGNRYRLTNGLKSWEEAQAEAESLGGNLVTLNDSSEEAWIRETFSTSERLWLGLNDRQTEGTFVWASGEPVTYTNWAPDEPNNYQFNGNFPEGEDYAVLNWNGSGQWNDYPNDLVGPFRGVIEIPG